MISKKEKSTNVEKLNASWYAIGLVCYSLTSFLFLIIVTRINGVDDAGVYSFGFGFATMIQVLANYAGRTFQVTERKKDIWDSDFLLFKIINCAIMILFGLIFCSFRSYEPDKYIVIMILVAYRALDAYSESIFAIFQKHNKLYKCGISMTLKSCFCIVVFFIVDFISHNLLISVLSILLVDIFFFYFYDCLNLKKYQIKFRKLSINVVKYLVIAGTSIFLMSFLSQYISMAQKYIIDFFMNHEDQAIFGIIQMPATFVNMCAAMIINPFLYSMNEHIKQKQYKLFNRIVVRIIFYVVIIGILALLASFFIGIPVLNIIYNLDLNEQLWPLMIIVLGSIALAIIGVLSNSMIAIRKNVSQLVMYIIASLYTSTASYVLVMNFGLFGAALAYGSTMIVLMIMYVIVYSYTIKKLLKNN